MSPFKEWTPPENHLTTTSPFLSAQLDMPLLLPPLHIFLPVMVIHLQKTSLSTFSVLNTILGTINTALEKKKKADLKPNCLGSNPSLASYQLCDLGGYLLFASGFFICKMKITIPIFHEVMRIKLPLLSHSSGVAYFLRQKQSWHIQTAEMGWSTGSEWVRQWGKRWG